MVCLIFNRTPAQTVSPVPDFRIVSCDAKLVGYTYSISGETQSIPPHSFGNRSGYIYEVTLVVGLLNDVQSSNALFGIICHLPDGKNKGVILNQGQTLIEGVVSNPFVFQIQTAKKGLATFEIGTVNPEANGVNPIPNVPEDSKSSLFLD
jgi:hypothetical protein